MNERQIDGPNTIAAGAANALQGADGDFQPAAPTGNAWNRLILPLKIGLTLGALALVLRSVDLAAAWKFAREQNPWLILAAAALIAVQIVLGAIRWHLILKRLGAVIEAARSIMIFYIAVFFSACLWASVGGDLVRGWLAFRSHVNVRTSASSVILDRVATLAGVAIIMLATAPILLTRVGNDHAVMALVPIILAGAGLIGIVIVAQLGRISLGSWGEMRVARQLRSLAEATHAVFLAPASAAPVIALAIAAQVCGSFAAYIIARSLGLVVSPLDCLVLMQPVTLLAALPISIGGWGVREAAVVTLFGLIGVPSSAALVLSLQIGLLSIAVSLPGGIVFLMQKRKSSTPAA
jgi:glycosyltransferase 2 family protein